MILSSKIPFIDQNVGKMEILHIVQEEYVRILQFYVDVYWEHFELAKYSYKKESLRKWKFYPDKIINKEPKTFLSGQFRKAAKSQAIGAITSRTSRLNKKFYALEMAQKEARHDDIKKLQRLIQKERKLTKPTISPNTAMELPSQNFKLMKNNTTKTKDMVFEMSTMFSLEAKKEFGLPRAIYFVVNSHRHNNKLASNGVAKKSFLVGRDGFNIRYKESTPKTKSKGVIAAIDQGILNCVTMVDMNGNVHQSTKCNHGHDLNSIIDNMRCKKSGSVNFRQKQDHRTNYINWAINQLDLTNISELRLEHLFDMCRGKRVPRKFKHFPYREIRTKLQKACLQNGVRFVEQSNKHRSQRCSECGFVHRDNREGSAFHCTKCDHKDDSDINAAKNHLANISPIYTINPACGTTGFYWT